MFSFFKSYNFNFITNFSPFIFVPFIICLFTSCFLLYIISGCLYLSPLFCDSVDINDPYNMLSCNDINLSEGVVTSEGVCGDSKEKSVWGSLTNKIYNSSRRRFNWYFREQFKDKYDTYKVYKDSWNPDIKIRDEIKQDFKIKRDKVRLNFRTLEWFLNSKKRASNRRRS